MKSGACDSVYSNSVLVTVDAVPNGGTLNGGKSVCTGTNFANLLLNGTTGTITKWQSPTTSGFTSSVNDIINTTSAYTANNLDSTTYYRVVVVNGTCTVYSTTATVTVSPLTVVGTASGDTTVCASGSSVTVRLTGKIGRAHV